MMIELSKPLRSFFTPPEGLPREQGRFFVLWTVTCCLSFAVHSLVVPLFLWMDLTVLAFQSIISLFIWAFVFWVGRRRSIYAAITLGGFLNDSYFDGHLKNLRQAEEDFLMERN